MIGIFNIHNHILPEVDDGADDFKEALQMLKLEYQDGVRTVILTPHYRKGMFECPSERILRKYEQLVKEAKDRWKDLTVVLGCEFHANMDMVQKLEEHEQMTMGKSRCVLTEFSEQSEFLFIQERCYALLSNGYEPIIAHAERYRALYNHFDRIEQLVEMGVYIQMNAASIIGKDGFGMKWFCRKIMKQNLLHFVGDDAHNLDDRKPCMGKCAAYMKKIMGEDYAERILIANPKELIMED